MKKKLQSFIFVSLLLVSISAKANNTELNLNNPDVRKCLIDASKAEGWDIASLYLNSENKIVIIFTKEGQSNRVYTSNQAYNM